MKLLTLFSLALCLTARDHTQIGDWTVTEGDNHNFYISHNLRCSIDIPDAPYNQDRIEWSAYNDGDASNRVQSIVTWTENGAIKSNVIWFKARPETPEGFFHKFLRIAHDGQPPFVTGFKLEPTDWKTGPEIFKKRCLEKVDQLPPPIRTRIVTYYQR